MRLRTQALRLTLIVASLILYGCGDTDTAPLTGTRIDVLPSLANIAVDKGTMVKPIPSALTNQDYPQQGGTPNVVLGNLRAGGSFKKIWKTSVGSSGSDDNPLPAPPVISENFIYAMDSKSRVAAIALTTGKRVWRQDLRPANANTAYGGGIAYDNNVVYATTAYNEVIAMDAKTGKILWRKTLPSPLRSAPIIANGKLITVSIDNQVFCLSTTTKSLLWTQQGTPEPTTMLIASAPTISGNVVIVPYSSGELYALDLDNGSVVWQDVLTSAHGQNGIGALNDIVARPIVSGGTVYAIGNANMLAAIDLRTGQRLWSKEVAGLATPWLAGDNLFLVSSDNVVVALDGKTGRVAWVKQLPSFENMDKKSDPLIWFGPIMINDNLLVIANNGQIMYLYPANGQFKKGIKVPDDVSFAPLVAKGTIYVYLDSADIIAYH